MTAFLAIVQDTWRQSVHQWVLIVLIALQVLLAGFVVSTIEVRTAPDGSEFLTVRWAKDTDQKGLETRWAGLYADSLKDEVRYYEVSRERRREMSSIMDEWEALDHRVKTLENSEPNNAELPELREKRRAFEYERDRHMRETRKLDEDMRVRVNTMIDERGGHISKVRKGVEAWLADTTTAIFLLSMIGFIAACAIYIPNMLEHGSIDLVLSKPIRRWQIYFGKYVGGLLLYAVALIGVFVVIFVGVGIVSGVWYWAFFNALPMTIFSLTLLFSIIAWVGLWTRSTAMAMVIGYVYYLVVDTAVGHLREIPMIDEFPFIEGFAGFLKYSFPSFVWLRQAAEASVFSVYVFPWQHLIVGTLWLIICLGTSYNRFRINDY